MTNDSDRMLSLKKFLSAFTKTMAMIQSPDEMDDSQDFGVYSFESS
jgi:hypothetical protein